ncbi:Peptidase C1A papain C-terminal domain-containing protein [Caenorhabditis elegans]|uniref:Peptidase C1A papain C-terminal domain-containing protein n=1 Tax=Caenorhabditis elegans TaxID=6239 RepID=O16289_CAEEL|nr:Peptidase C1A papain C-terminal domain-containing protein [Caenorhabditis elegans]CCD74286.1 Peptidase C1A papain C-terminal domain-containing protein [Caenorhabditis elegans]|eukprot:NP_503384.1 Cysteine PRotease related [Caenorhabditis elegans]
MRKILICLIGVLFQADGVPPSEIDRIIHYVNSQKTTWTAGIPALSRNSMLKTLVTDAATIGFKIQNFGVSQANSDLSPSFDARERWPECMSIPQINDISECKTSWAFAAAESMSDRLCINSGGFKNTILSAEELLSCCTGMFSCGEGCEGGNPFKAWQYIQKHGIPTGGSYESQFGCKPYSIPPCGKTVGNVTYPACTNTTSPTPSCEKKCTSRIGYPIDIDKDRHYGVSVDQLPNSQIEIQSDVMLNGPIQATFEVYDDFLQYTTGIYVHLTGNKQGHLSVRIIGWGVWQGVPYWLCANSWGRQWGENGTFRVLRGTNECGLESNCVSGMPKLN